MKSITTTFLFLKNYLKLNLLSNVMLFLIFSLSAVGNAQTYDYEEVIMQDQGENDSNFGPSDGIPVHVAHYFPSDYLQQYQGMLLHQVEFYIFATPVSLEVKVWGEGTPTSPGPLLFSQVVPATDIYKEWVQVDLDIPIELVGQDLWIGYEVENEPYTGCIGTDAGPANTGFGDWYSVDGVNWIAFSEVNTWFQRSWNIKGHLKAPIIYQRDVAVTNIINPNSAANLSAEEEITIQIKNYGFETQTSIPYTVNWPGQQYDGVYIGSLATEEIVEVTLPVTTDLSEYGIYAFEACTNLPGDELPELDCASKEVVNRVPELCNDNLYLFGCDMDRISYWSLANINLPEIECPSNGSAYLDFRNEVHEFIAGETYELSVKSTFIDHHFAVWIDYSDNLEFSPDELVLADGYCEVADTEYTFNITIPEDAPEGDFVMRMRSQWNAPVVDPCETYEMGLAIDFTANVVNPLAIQDFDQNNIRIYPNPFTEQIKIDLPENLKDGYTFTVMDLSGRTIYSRKQTSASGNSFEWDGSALSNGIYLVSLRNESFYITKKIIKN